MPTAVKHKDDNIKVRQFITDTKGHKMAAVIDIEELNRLETVLDLIPPSEAWLYKNKKALVGFKGIQLPHGLVGKKYLEQSAALKLFDVKLCRFALGGLP